ncbi:MAG: GHKL domain-containing protein [Gammaproteobacteria bacterium]|nr:GHKL domain-containing protein [Gammaproteobacteria bacterium]
MLSLNARVLIAASAILAAFFGLAGVTLDRAYHVSSEEALKKRLEIQVYALIALAAIDDEANVYMPDIVPETSFLTWEPDTHAQITDSKGRVIWRSPTPVGIEIPYKVRLFRNERDFSYALIDNNNHSFAMYSLGIAWDDKSMMHVYTFSVAENLAEYDKRAIKYRRNLWGLLGGVALLLLLMQGAIMRWGLAPLDQAAEELSAIESGKQLRLKHEYPGELRALTGNVNALLEHQQEHLERYRHTLGDLAHSLKTPLAVLQSTIDKHHLNEKITQTIQDQLNRMVQITEYQLQRAATAGQSPLLAPVILVGMVEIVIKSLSKVYADKSVVVEKKIESNIVFHGDEGDMMEIIGNLMDNAFKWCNKRVLISAKREPHTTKHTAGIIIQIEDDGPGVPDEMVKRVVQRGVRADQGISGHGIGLSIVQDIVQIYGGELKIVMSRLGGASLSIWLPDTA